MDISEYLQYFSHYDVNRYSLTSDGQLDCLYIEKNSTDAYLFKCIDNYIISDELSELWFLGYQLDLGQKIIAQPQQYNEIFIKFLINKNRKLMLYSFPDKVRISKYYITCGMLTYFDQYMLEDIFDE